MRARIFAGIVGVFAVLLAGMAPLPSQTNQAPAPSRNLTVQEAHAEITSISLTPPEYDDRPKVINPETYNKYTGPNLSKRVVLTYDDCPKNLDTLTAVLKYAAGNNIGLVLAPTGDCYDTFKRKYTVNIGELIRSHGQYAINHTRSHPNLTTRAPENIQWELSGEVKADYGRPPYGARNNEVDSAYAAVGMREWLWNVDSRDWENGGKTEAEIVDYVANNACAGCTVLMHMQHAGFSPHAISTIAERLQADATKPSLCRPFRGWANLADDPVRPAPATWGNHALPC